MLHCDGCGDVLHCVKEKIQTVICSYTGFFFCVSETSVEE